MKILLSKESIAKIALLMLLSLSAVTSMTILVNAAPPKDPNVIIYGSGSVELTWKSAKSETYSSNAYANLGGLDTIAITPTHGWHISAVLIDEDLIDEDDPRLLDEDGFSLSNIKAKNMAVTFVENGGVDDVDPMDLDAYPDPDVGLLFSQVTVAGEVYAYTIGLPPPGTIGDSWNVTTTLEEIVGQVNVTLILNMTVWGISKTEALLLTMWRTEVVVGDVNLDGIVDGTDISIIANANPNEYDPNLDLTGDGHVNDDDVTEANHHMGEESVWVQLEDSTSEVIDDLVYVYGLTDHFSIFGAH